jgi:hypothetical protein
MLKRASVLIAFALTLMMVPTGARAAASTFHLSVKGALLNSFSSTTCGDQLGDTYDTFCPSGSCSCSQYDDPDKIRFNGNMVGSAKAGTVHFTRDGGSDGTGVSGHTGLGCNPVFGEMQVPGSKDVETIYFNGSICQPQANSSANTAARKMTGGWSIHSSSHGIHAFGTFTGNFQFNAIGFNMKFTGEIH